jgi:hypothetical protein
MTTHRVKSWTYLFNAVKSGLKKHDFRNVDERDYKVGDVLVLCEYDQATGQFTGNELPCRITYMTDYRTPCAMSSMALDKKATVLSIEPIKES